MKRSALFLLPLLFCLFLATATQVSAQQVSNVNARLSGENVIITYDLVGTKVGQKFKIELFSSNDNYGAPLQLVSGHVGEDQLGGSGKQIEWRAKEELGVFSGNITFEVRSTVTFTPIQITSPVPSSSFKPGKSLPIKWTGGMPNTTFQIELMKGNTLSNSIGTSSNTQSYNWTIPKDITKGSDYQIKMYDIQDRASTEITSGNFIVKSAGGAKKIIIPVLAVGATAGILCAVKVICPDNPEDPVNTDLPVPPNPDGMVGAARFKSGMPLIAILIGN
jgi:hypothetical protein